MEYTLNEKKLAEFLHEEICHWDHMDQCDWEYSNFDNPRNIHIEYLEKARRLIAMGESIDLDSAKNIKRQIEIARSML